MLKEKFGTKSLSIKKMSFHDLQGVYDIEKLSKNLKIIFKGKWKQNKRIEKWDGNTSRRILKILKSIL